MHNLILRSGTLPFSRPQLTISIAETDLRFITATLAYQVFSPPAESTTLAQFEENDSTRSLVSNYMASLIADPIPHPHKDINYISHDR